LKIAIITAGLSHMGAREANHSKLVRQQVAGARKALSDAGIPKDNIYEIECPGVLEIPHMTRTAIRELGVDGAVSAALIINGEIYRHEFVAQTSLELLMQIPIDTDIPVASSLLTPVEPRAPEEQFDFLKDHLFDKGEEAAGALLLQIIQLQTLKGNV